MKNEPELLHLTLEGPEFGQGYTHNHISPHHKCNQDSILESSNNREDCLNRRAGTRTTIKPTAKQHNKPLVDTISTDAV